MILLRPQKYMAVLETRTRIKGRVAFQSVLAGLFAMLLAYRGLLTPAMLSALAIRRRMPDASFSSTITWCAEFLILSVSLVLGLIIARIVFRHAAGENNSRAANLDKPRIEV